MFPNVLYSSLFHSVLQAKLDVQSKLRSAQAEVSQLQENVEEEQANRNNLSKQLAVAKNESIQWKSKAEGEVAQKMEELEESR